MEIKDILRNRRLELHLKLKQVADAVGVSEGTVSKWESGNISSMRIDKAAALAKILSIDPRLLLGQSEDEYNSEIEKNERPEFQSVPLIGNVAAGNPRLMYEDVLGWEQVDYSLAESGRLFALRIGGDSMEPDIKKGSVAIVRMQETVDNGDVAIVKINGDEATCKRVQKTDGGIMLVSNNSAYLPMYFNAKEMNSKPVSIIGRVMEIRTKY